MPNSSRSVLISGASIAGPVLAFWLHRYGWQVTVVERASAVRSGGYPIDIRGTALEVVRRMGLLPAIEAAHIQSRSLCFVDSAGSTIGTIAPTDLAANEAHDVELPRGVLTSLVSDLTRNTSVQYRFGDSIRSLHDTGTGVDVRFESGEQARYDVVLGADGLHSNTRRLAFGPEQPFRRDLGFRFTLFALPNDLGLSHGAIIYSEPGRTALVMAIRDSHELGAMLAFADESPDPGARLSRDEQLRRTAQHFSAGGWQVPRLVAAMQRADELYFDAVSQIRMPHWSLGRVGLVGDSAFAPSFLSGQGTSLALVGAFVLAGELSSHDDPAAALQSYERLTRPFVEANQDLATRKDAPSLLARTPETLDARNRWLRSLGEGNVPTAENTFVRDAHNALTLPLYTHLER